MLGRLPVRTFEQGHQRLCPRVPTEQNRTERVMRKSKHNEEINHVSCCVSIENMCHIVERMGCIETMCVSYCEDK